ncbi:MAG: ASKHA domain-containing protein [bacterium]
MAEILLIKPSGCRTLQEILLKMGVNLGGDCGGQGSCGKCRVKIIGDGKVYSVRSCQFIPPKPLRVKIEPAFSQPVVRDQMLDSKNLNLVADIGTTTIALAAVDRHRRRIVYSQTVLNPQIRFGADTITRISRERLVGGVRITDVLSGFMSKNGLDRRRKVTAVGNTAMMHFLFRESPAALGVYPHHSRLPLKRAIARRLDGLRLQTLPLLGSFLGSDCTAAILAAGLDRSRQPTLLIDAGTNGEVVLGNRERILACSTAAGPAFEGATLRCGSLAIPGAISSCRFYHGGWRLKTIGGLKPKGICGSGVLDAVAEGVRAGLILRSGRIAGSNPLYLYQNGPGSIYLTQADIREVQLAKAAIAGGIKVLIKEWSRFYEPPFNRVFITGRFGARINPRAAFRIGLLPNTPVKTPHQHPDLALIGAVNFLNSMNSFARAEHIARITTEILLSEHPDFERYFIDSMEFAPWQTLPR